MLRNLLKISLRNLIKNKSHTAINVAGLSLGLTAAIIIYKVVMFEMSFDKYHENSEHTYRLVIDALAEGERYKQSGVPYKVGENFKADFAEVKYFTIVDRNIGSPVITFADDESKKFGEKSRKIAFVNEDYFRMFDYKFIAGDAASPFGSASTVVLSKNLADKYFGDHTNALGKVIIVNNEYELTVSAIVENPPLHTDFPFEILVSIELGEEKDRAWGDWVSSSSSVQFYVTKKENVAITSFQDNAIDYINTNKSPEDPDTYELILESLSSQHFNTERYNLSGRSTSYETILTLSVIGALLILAACINFINLNTALVSKRAKEIGVRKVLGSSRTMLVAQFISETAIIVLFSMVISLGLAELSLIRIEALTGFTVPQGQYNLDVWIFLAVLFVMVTLLSSFYPAMVLSGYRPAEALKSKANLQRSGGFSLRKILIIVQLFIAQALIIVIFAMSEQISYFMNAPLGIDTEAVVIFNIPDPPSAEKFETFRNQLTSHPDVRSATFSNTGSISNNTWGGVIEFTNNEPQRVSSRVKLIDEHYLTLFDIELLAGRNIKTDTAQYLINERLLYEMGYENPEDVLGLRVTYWGREGTIIGVIKNFNSTSLHAEMSPVLFAYNPNLYFQAAVKLEQINQTALDHIKNEWEALFPTFIYSNSFLDDDIVQFYESEQRAQKVFSTFGAVALFIGAIGLLGLISFMTNSKTKEIGVRKVLGASVEQVIVMLSKDFVWLVLIAAILAVPVSYYFLDTWLGNFEYRIPISAKLFLGGLISTLIITIAIVSFKSYKAASVNPVESLKDE